jgi:hypothetical protein
MGISTSLAEELLLLGSSYAGQRNRKGAAAAGTITGDSGPATMKFRDPLYQGEADSQAGR